jgi:putative ABC transport system substrate-binding protein
MKKIGVLLCQQGSSELLETITNAAAKYKVTIIPIQIENEKEIPRKLRSSLEEVDALWMLDDAYILSKESLEFTISSSSKCNLPFMAISEVFVKEGALISLSPSSFDNGKQAAQLVRKILKEKTSPRDIPISYHLKPDLVLNLETAKQIGLVIPLELLDKAKKTF